MAIMTDNITIKPKPMHQIAIIAFEGISLFHLSVPVAIFKDAISESALFNITICAEQIGTLKTADGTKIQIEHDLNILKDADILIFPSWHPNGRQLVYASERDGSVDIYLVDVELPQEVSSK